MTIPSDKDSQPSNEQEASYVIYFHSSRVKNLQQMLRFLHKREKVDELILVCQDSCSLTEHNLNLGTYNKAVLCNYGVNKATKPVVALLDSDRILPPGYFRKAASLLREKLFISTCSLYSLRKDYSDEEIENKNIKFYEDFRSKTNQLMKKNLFSGNTVFFKKDYVPMDENYIGYGFCDNDAAQNKDALWLDDMELHLFHPIEMYWKGIKMTDNDILAAINALRYLKKWNLPRTEEFNEWLRFVKKKLDIYPGELVSKLRVMEGVY